MSDRYIKGVVFDLDGTLYSLSCIKLRMVFALRSDLRFLQSLSVARDSLRTRVFADREALHRALFEGLSHLSGASASRAEEWYKYRFLNHFSKMLAKSARVRPGLNDLLNRLKERGVKIAVLSDYGNVSERLTALGIGEEVFDAVTSAEDFGVLKPSPRPLIALSEKWGVEPSAVIVVGDRDDLDARGAVAAGMKFLGINGKKKGQKSSFDFVKWSEAVRILDMRAARRPDRAFFPGEPGSAELERVNESL